MTLAPLTPVGRIADAPTALVAHLARHGARPALLGERDQVTYEDLAGRVARAAARLGTTRRLVLLPVTNTVDALVWYLAALAGRHPVLLVGGREDAVEEMVAAYDPDVVVQPDAEQTLLERRESSAHDLHPELALLLSTSGSTGSPKLVRLSRRNLLANAQSIAEYLDVRPSDRAVTSLPPHYCYGLSVVHTHLLRGAALVLTDLSVVDPAFWDLVRQHGVTSLAGVPYTFELLDRVGFAEMDLPHLRYLTQAGGRLDPERVRAYAELGRRRGWDLFVMYGQTEATARMAYLPPERALTDPHTIGLAVPGGRFDLDPVEGVEDGTGELVYTGPNVMMGYAQSPADLACPAELTRLRTGDLARRTDDGLYEIVGRRSRFAKVFGLRIDLDRLESLLAAGGHPGHCVAAGPGVVVAVEPGADAGVVRQLVADGSGLPRRAVRVVEVSDLPRRASGKPDYPSILALVAPPPPRPAAAGTDVQQVSALFAEVLDHADVPVTSTFVGLGGDSLSYVELSLRLEELLGELPADWHTLPLAQLVARPATEAARGRRWRPVDTTVVLRAVSIVLVIGSHAGLFAVRGGAHVLLAVAGYNLARFHLTDAPPRKRARRLLRSVMRVAVPSVVWIAAMFLLTDLYRVENVLLVHSFFGPDAFAASWAYWFVETLVWTVVALAVLLRIPAVHCAERRWPFAFAAALLGLGLFTRFGLVTIDTGPDRIHTPHLVFWFFALGWAAAAATARWQRAAVAAVVVLAVPGFFTSAPRTLLVVAGLLLLVWCRTLPVPALLVPLTGVLASASLYLYLTHFQVYVLWASPLLGVLASLAVGVGYWWLVRLATTRLARPLQGASGRSRRARTGR
jgi:non-ribosomal peptide synthetase component E (peptide arylation enzyme)